MTPGATLAGTTGPGDTVLAPPVARKPSGRKPPGKAAAPSAPDAVEFGALLASPSATARKAAPARGTAPATHPGPDVPTIAAIPLPVPPDKILPPVPGQTMPTPPIAVPTAPGPSGRLPATSDSGKPPAEVAILAAQAPPADTPPTKATHPDRPDRAEPTPSETLGTAQQQLPIASVTRRTTIATNTPSLDAASSTLRPAPGNPAPPPILPDPPMAGTVAAMEVRSGTTLRRSAGREAAATMPGSPAIAAAGDSARISASDRSAHGTMAQRTPPAADTGRLPLVNVPFSFQNSLSGNGHAAGDSATAAPATPPDQTLPANAGPASNSFADITIGMDAHASLAVRLAAADETAAQRLRGEIDVLERALAAIGSDVEAIDIALRGPADEYGPGREDESPVATGADVLRAGAGSAEAEGWGGNAGGNSNGAGFRAERAGQGPAASAAPPSIGSRNASDGKVDRYG